MCNDFVPEGRTVLGRGGEGGQRGDNDPQGEERGTEGQKDRKDA